MEIGLAMIITQLIATLAVLLGIGYSAWAANREHIWAQEARISAQIMAVETYKTIMLLEQHTNGMQAALMKASFKDGEASDRVKEQTNKP